MDNIKIYIAYKRIYDSCYEEYEINKILENFIDFINYNNLNVKIISINNKFTNDEKDLYLYIYYQILSD